MRNTLWKVSVNVRGKKPEENWRENPMKVWKNRTHVLKCISVFLQSSAWRTNICILPADSVMLWRWISDFDCMSFVELISFFYKKFKNSSMEKLCPYRPFWFWCLQSKSVKEKIITRIIVSRCEVDLMKVRAEFKRNFGKSLHQTILVSFHLSLFLHIFSVIYISLLFLLLVCLHSRSMFNRNVSLYVFLLRSTPRVTTRELYWTSVEEMTKHL